MSVVHIVRRVPVPLERVWATVTDVSSHGAAVPFTHMRTDPAPMAVGWRFDAVTRLGPVRFTDSMVVDVWEPPSRELRRGRFAIRKVGRLLGGSADIVVEAVDAGTTMILWAEEIIVQPARVGRALAPVVDPCVALLFGRVVDKLAAEAAS
jgi:hypothetical protein